MRIRKFCRTLRHPRRASRSRGFGVHSPFAFRFIREVISQPCGYYCYNGLDRMARAEGLSPETVRAIFRISLALRPQRVKVTDSDSEAIRTALATGNPQSPDDSPAVAFIALKDGRERLEEQWAGNERGMLFKAKEMAVFVKSDRLPHQKFRIMLP